MDKRDTPVLSASGLRVAIGDTEILRGIDVQLRAGEKVGVVGESGCGKSTLALALMGLLPEKGRITHGDVNLAGTRLDYEDERALNTMRGNAMSLVFQDPLTSLSPVKSIGHQLAEVIRQHDPRASRQAVRARSIALLAGVGVPDAATRLGQFPHQYSGGMRQRILIAIAIANEPQVLIADEPTTALDVTTQAQVLDLLDSLVERMGISIVLVTHDIGVVTEFCDRALVMYAGRVVEEVTTDGMFDRVAHPYTRALLDCLPLPGRRSRDHELQWISGAPPSLDMLPSGCSFAPRCDWAQPACAETEPSRIVVNSSARQVVACRRADEVLWPERPVPASSVTRKEGCA